MKLRSTICSYTLLSLALTVSVFGAMSKENTEFAKGPTSLLLTREEKKQWEGVKTDEQAQAFIDLFWARRDPTPGTPANEFRDLINERIKYADGQYNMPKLRGGSTDRGKVYVLMGSPSTLRRGGSGNIGVHAPDSTFGSSTNLNETSAQGFAPHELWQYEQLKSDLKLGQQVVKVAFSDQYASGVWKMERSPGTDYAAVFDRIATSYVAQPDLKAVPNFAASTASSGGTLRSERIWKIDVTSSGGRAFELNCCFFQAVV